MTFKTGKKTGEEKQMKETICECNECDGNSGWKWVSRDLGNRITDGTRSHKAGQFWAEVCPAWKAEHGDEELPPNPPGISDMSKWMYGGKGQRGRGGFHGN